MAKQSENRQFRTSQSPSSKVLRSCVKLHHSPVSLPRATRPDSRMKTQSRIAQIQCHQSSQYIMQQFTFDICQAFIPQTYKTIDSNHNSLQLAFLLDGQAYIMSNRKFRYLFSANSFSSSGDKNIFIGTSQLIQIFISQKLLHFFAISISPRGARIYHLRLFSYFRYLFLTIHCNFLSSWVGKHK